MADAAAQAYLDSLRARIAGSPDVEAVSQVWLAPWGNSHMGAAWRGRQFAGNRVDTQFLDTMRMRLVRGRNFLPGEEGVAMISEAAERVLWRDGDALGKSLPWDTHGSTVIGVVRNASTGAVGITEPLEFYLPQLRSDAPDSVLLLRVSGQPNDFVRRFQDAARALDGRLQPAVLVVSDAYDGEVKRTSQALAANRHPGLRGPRALGHRVGRTGGLHGSPAHARDRPADRARRTPWPDRARHSRPDEPGHRHRVRLRRAGRGGRWPSRCAAESRRWPGSTCSIQSHT